MQGLKWWRRAKGLSQRELAERSGVAKRTICMIEQGKHEEPRPETLRKLAEGLGVEPMDLILGELAVAVHPVEGTSHQITNPSPRRGVFGTAPTPHERQKITTEGAR